MRSLKCFLYLYNIFEEKIRNEVRRQIALIVVTVFILIVFIATLLELFENHYRRRVIKSIMEFCLKEQIERMDLCLYSSKSELNFHKWIYFVIVTLSTVGYGDIVPTSVVGKIFFIFFLIPGHIMSICLFVFAIILIPKQTGELINLMDMQKVYQRAVYKSTKKTDHLVLTGFINKQAFCVIC